MFKTLFAAATAALLAPSANAIEVDNGLLVLDETTLD
jgi:hypothetical protein